MFSAFKEQSCLQAPSFRVIFVLGGPGVGKGTQCARISDHFGFIHLSAGDLLRQERDKAQGSELGQKIQNCMDNGIIVPVEITCELLRAEMKRQFEKNGHESFLIDGFPRNEDNLRGWEKTMHTVAHLLFVLVFDAPDDVCVARCLGRGRGDDQEATIRRRVKQFHSECENVIHIFEKRDLVRKVAAEKSSEEVWEDVKRVISAAI